MFIWFGCSADCYNGKIFFHLGIEGRQHHLDFLMKGNPTGVPLNAVI